MGTFLKFANRFLIHGHFLIFGTKNCEQIWQWVLFSDLEQKFANSFSNFVFFQKIKEGRMPVATRIAAAVYYFLKANSLESAIFL